MGDFLQFRFVPTMRCNLKCTYCFLEHSTGNEPTMFDNIPPAEWIKAMKSFSKHEVEFYMWGGEPFCIDGTFDLINGLMDYDFVKWARIDSNLTYTKKIVGKCSSEKINILCSWHTEVFDFGQYWSLINLINDKKMVGLANFVASDTNIQFLKKNNLRLDDLIKKFDDKGIFFNVAADFNKKDDPDYKAFILQYMTEDDWNHIHGNYPSLKAPCDASGSFFSVGFDGTITSCGVYKKSFFSRKSGFESVGNFFNGTIRRKKSTQCPVDSCKSIVAYSHRLDNQFQPFRHLEGYIQRNMEHRKQTGKA